MPPRRSVWYCWIASAHDSGCFSGGIAYTLAPQALTGAKSCCLIEERASRAG